MVSGAPHSRFSHDSHGLPAPPSHLRDAAKYGWGNRGVCVYDPLFNMPLRYMQPKRSITVAPPLPKQRWWAFLYTIIPCARTGLTGHSGPPTPPTVRKKQRKDKGNVPSPRKKGKQKPRPILSPNMLHDWPGAHSSSPMASPAPTRASPPPPSPPVLSPGLEVYLLDAPHPSRPGGGVSHPLPVPWLPHATLIRAH